MTGTSPWARLRRNAVPIALALALAFVAFLCRGQLSDWFSGGAKDEKSTRKQAHEHGDGGADAAREEAATPSHTFSALAHKELARALAAYEEVRAVLAGDRVDGLRAPAGRAGDALRAARTAEPGAPAELLEHLAAGADAADALAEARELAAARADFAQLSKHVVALTAADATLAEGMHVFECSMTKGYNKWLQPNSQLANPYQGPKMLTCGSPVDWEAVGASAPTEHSHDPEEIAHYTCPMDTWVKKSEPGTCPVCGMDLVPVTKEELRTGVMRIDHRRRQLIGLRTGLVERREMTVKIRAIGRVAYDESRLADVALKYDGWVHKLRVNTMGEKVRKGQVLFTIYSPDLYTAQQEYLLALSQQKAAPSEAAKARAEALVRGARQRLKLWDLSNFQLGQIAKRKTPLQYVAVESPADGYVVEKNVVEGAGVKSGQRLFRIAALDKVWVEADIYEQDIPFVKVGQPTDITLSHLPGRTFSGKVAFVYPYLDGATRTARVRVELPNPELELKPDMYANVEVSAALGERLVVPEPAVIYSGPRRIVFLDMDAERLRPQQIEVGVKSDGFFEVLSGLEENQRVVISGNFLLSAESRLKAATGLW